MELKEKPPTPKGEGGSVSILTSTAVKSLASYGVRFTCRGKHYHAHKGITGDLWIRPNISRPYASSPHDSHVEYWAAIEEVTEAVAEGYRDIELMPGLPRKRGPKGSWSPMEAT